MNRWIDKEVVRFLDRVGKRVCKQTGMTYKRVKPMHPTDTLYEGCSGSCEYATGDIRVKTTKLTGKFYTIEYLIDTMIHEIAHCGSTDEEADHGKEWRYRYRVLKGFVKKYVYGK